MESFAELQARQDRDFAESPNIQIPELRERLRSLRVADEEIKQGIEENEVPILFLTLKDSTFARIDKRALAKLELDSRYRFDLTDPEQIHVFAQYVGAETHARDKAKALRELAEKDETDKIPRYRAGMNMLSYARSLELYCGYKPGDALRVIDDGWLDYTHKMASDAAMDAAQGRSWASFACVKRVVDATDLRRHFIGNRGREGAVD